MRSSHVRRGWSAIAVAAVMAAALASCGNDITTDIVGTAGVTVDAGGDPLVVVVVCKDAVDTVSVVEGREGLDADEPNPEVGTWTASSPQQGTVTIDVGDPGPTWTPSTAIQLKPGTLYIVSASRSDKDEETSQVSFRLADLAAITPSQVIVRSGAVWSRSTLADRACD